MRVLHVIRGISRASGGPARSSQGLVAGLRAAGVDAWLYTLNYSETPWVKGVDKFVNGGAFEDALVKVKPDIVHLHGIWDLGLHRCAVICRRWKIPYVIAPRGMLEPWSLEQKWLKKRVARWLYQDWDLKRAAALHATAESEAEQFRKLGFKNYVIVSPNGVNVPEEKCLNVGIKECLNGEESSSLESKSKNGIADQLSSTSTSNFNSAHSNIQTFKHSNIPRRALFVSRMHPKKGVLELVESWARVFKPSPVLRVPSRADNQSETVHSQPQPLTSTSPWVCELVYTLNGDTEREYEAKVKQRILELGLTYEEKCLNGGIGECLNEDGESSSYESKLRSGGIHSSTSTTNFNSAHSNIQTFSHSNISTPDFILTGPLNDDQKWAAYARADLFILPTYSENFGIVVAEALWAGVPVITTKGTPWSELVSHRCGWWIDLPEAESPSCESKFKSGGSHSNIQTFSNSNISPSPWPALDSALREATSGALGDRALPRGDESGGLIEAALPESINHSSTSTSNFNSSHSNIQTFKHSNISLRAMGANGHALVESKYTWSAVVKAMIHGYEQILNPCEFAPCDSCRSYGDTCPIK